MAEKCYRCQKETVNPVRARREVKTYSGESNYIYILACLDCFETMDQNGLEILGDDGQPLDLKRSHWRENPQRPEIKPTKGVQLLIEQVYQLDLFEDKDGRKIKA